MLALTLLRSVSTSRRRHCQQSWRGCIVKRIGLKRIGAAGSAVLMATLALTACSSSSKKNASGGGGKITMGFAQVGAESGWRTANTKSIQQSAKDAGITLKFSDAQGKQENQIKAIRSYIQQK